MIEPREVSVVVQGPIVKNDPDSTSDVLTQDVVRSVRTHLPGAQIILSTWQGADLDGLEIDECILNEDPGAIAPNPLFPSRLNNVNRQLVSTRNGLARATRKYVVKLRTDSTLSSAKFLAVPRNLVKRSPRWSFFRERVLVPAQGSVHPAVVPSLYHVSDLFQFGLTADLQELWSSPLAPEPETSRAYSPEAPPPLVYNVVEGPCVRAAPEQFYIVSFLQRRGLPARISYAAECGTHQAALSLLALANNFVVASQIDLGVNLPRRITESSIARLCAESRPWAVTARRLSWGPGSIVFLLPELLRIKLKWLHFWYRYSLKPRLRKLFA